MSVGHLDQCRSCLKPIQWAVTDNDKHMPVDAFPDPERGNVSLYPDGGLMRAVVVPKAKAAAMRARGHQLHLSHHTTCPDGPKWRNR